MYLKASRLSKLPHYLPNLLSYEAQTATKLIFCQKPRVVRETSQIRPKFDIFLVFHHFNDCLRGIKLGKLQHFYLNTKMMKKF